MCLQSPAARREIECSRCSPIDRRRYGLHGHDHAVHRLTCMRFIIIVHRLFMSTRTRALTKLSEDAVDVVVIDTFVLRRLHNAPDAVNRPMPMSMGIIACCGGRI